MNSVVFVVFTPHTSACLTKLHNYESVERSKWWPSEWFATVSVSWRTNIYSEIPLTQNFARPHTVCVCSWKISIVDTFYCSKRDNIFLLIYVWWMFIVQCTRASIDSWIACALRPEHPIIICTSKCEYESLLVKSLIITSKLYTKMSMRDEHFQNYIPMVSEYKMPLDKKKKSKNIKFISIIINQRMNHS